MDLIGPALYTGVTLCFYSDVHIYIVQASYSQPDGGFFFIEIFTARVELLERFYRAG
jgi:hypothetical protein